MRPHLIRPLTDRERALARGVFGDALDDRRIRLHRAKRYWFQPANCAMAPDGDIWFPPACWQDDYATDVMHAAWLVHELTHVWQHQQRVWVRLRGCIERRYRYGALLTAARLFARYGIEQQAAIVEDRFRLGAGLPTRFGSGSIADYAAILPFGPTPTTAA